MSAAEDMSAPVPAANLAYGFARRRGAMILRGEGQPTCLHRRSATLETLLEVRRVAGADIAFEAVDDDRFAPMDNVFVSADGVRLVRLDGDWYDSTIVCLEHLYPLVADGGVIIIDDYFDWDGCCRAVHDHLSRTGSSDRLRTSRADEFAYIIKGAGPS